MSRTPDTASDPDLRVRVELVDLLFAGSKVAVATTFIGPVLVGWLFYPLIGTALAVWPALLILGLHAERAWFIARFQVARGQPDYAPEPWARGTQWRLAIMGVAISLWVLALMLTRDGGGIFLAVVLVVVLAAASLQYSVYPRTVEVYLTPLLLGCSLQLLWLGAGFFVPAFFLSMTWLTLIAASRRFGRTMRSNIELRLRNERLNHELTLQKAVAEDASAAKTRFLAAASHDLRQPVQSIMLLSEALQERGESPGNRELLGKLRTGVDHFANALDEIMDIARLDAGQVLVHPQAVRLTDLLARVETVYRMTAEAKGLGLFLRPPADERAAVWVDPALVWRILSNLVGNALHYTNAGHVMVAVRRGRHVNPETGDTAPGWRFEVRDSGIGIDPALQQLVFEAFFQVDNLHRDRREGVGLGLAVVQRLVRLMDLRLELRSRPGWGSVFAVTMPACSLPVEAVAQEIPDLPDGHGLCVLVVDDDSPSREAMQALLASWGVQTRGAGSADEAAAEAASIQAQGIRLHGLLTDHWLPDGQSSVDVDTRVRQALQGRAARNLATAVFTGDNQVQTREAVQARGWTFWQKPARPWQLRQWLASLLLETPNPVHGPAHAPNSDHIHH
ncbi:MAG: HAMP domain-containing sensor histidine kinase [Burkholderiaceae bacterium]